MNNTKAQVSPLHKNDSTGLRSPGLLAKYPIIGILMFVFGSLIFGGLTYNLLAQGPLLEWDRVIANTLPAIGLKSPAYVESIMNASFYIGDQVIMGLAILLAIYFIYKRYWQEFAMVAIGVPGSSGLFLSLSHYFARTRPPTQIWIIENIPGYPSGHAITVIAFYGLLAYLLFSKMPSAFWKSVMIAAAIFLIVFIGFSRVFTGGHYLTDVLAGYAVGIAWSGLIYTLIEAVFQKNRSKNVKKE
jgi:undecaprenyl-diphosphatase